MGNPKLEKVLAEAKQYKIFADSQAKLIVGGTDSPEDRLTHFMLNAIYNQNEYIIGRLDEMGSPQQGNWLTGSKGKKSSDKV